MSEQTGVKPEALPDLDDLLQCPVCYEIPSGQIFQCNEGHHVCGRCKMRLDVCPVCRALFFGTRNYAMEELIANVRKLRAFKLGGKVTTDTLAENSSTPQETPAEVTQAESVEGNGSDVPSTQSTLRAPQSCKGVFRCLACKTGNSIRLPAARLLNHLRYFHSPELIEGKSENGEYLQAWQFATSPGRLVTAVRVADMGIFFLIIEISHECVYAWLSMASSPWVAHEFSYTLTISGNDREAIFSDCVWSVRSCEGSLKKRGHCLSVTGGDAVALITPLAISVKLSVRRTPPDQLTQQTQPRAVLRVATRGSSREAPRTQAAHELEPFLQDLQNDVARLSRAFATLGREANALVRSEAEIRVMVGNRIHSDSNEPTSTSTEDESESTTQSDQPENMEGLSRSARRRMRNRLRAALNGVQPPPATVTPPPVPAPRSVNQYTPRPPPSVGVPHPPQAVSAPRPPLQVGAPRPAPPVGAPRPPLPMGAPRMLPVGAPRPPPVPPSAVPRIYGSVPSRFMMMNGLAVVQPVGPPPLPPLLAPQASSGPSNGIPQNGNSRNKKRKPRYRR